MYQRGSDYFKHHVEKYGTQDKFGYKDFVPMFRGEKFEPDEWADIFKSTGARFVIEVAEHHDGFQMYDSAICRWNAKQMGPKRDVIGELAKSVRERDMVFGVSSNRAEHNWFFSEGRKFDSDVNDPAYHDLYGPANPAPQNPGCPYWENHFMNSPDTEYLEDWFARTCEIIEKYQPQLLFFDWWIMNFAFKPYLKKLASYYYNMGVKWGKGVAINYKYDAMPVGTGVLNIERGQLSEIRGLLWQADTCVSKKSWGYIDNDEYKTPEHIICDLADIVSKNGVMLLNVGPRPDGTIPEEVQRILSVVGEWLKINGEAIYETKTWMVHGEGPTQIADGAFTENRGEFSNEDIRFTANADGSILYAIILKPQENGTVCVRNLYTGSPSFPYNIQKIEMLDGGAPVEWERAGHGLILKLGKTSQNLAACPAVVKIIR